MKRFAAPGLVILVAFAGSTAPAVACTRFVPTLDGETPEQASQRTTLEWQDREMREAAHVFLADVVELTRDGNRFEAVIIPRASIKGTLPLRPVRYEISQVGISCGDWDFPGLDGPVLFYADSPALIRGSIDVSHLEDAQLQQRVFSVWDQNRMPPRHPRAFSLEWPWAVAGALISLVVGYGIARIRWPKFNKAKTK